MISYKAVKMLQSVLIINKDLVAKPLIIEKRLEKDDLYNQQ